MLVLLWRLLDEHPTFLTHITDHLDCEILSLITALLYYIASSKSDPNKIGVIYTCNFLLLKISGQRECNVALNRAYPAPALKPFPLLAALQIVGVDEASTYADLLIIVCHDLIVSANQSDALLKVLLTFLTNISPYLTRISLAASAKLLNLFEIFSSPAFLQANPTNHHYVELLIDCYNNIIQYQYAGNSALVYCIFRKAQLFFRIGKNAQGKSSPTSSSSYSVTPGATPSTTTKPSLRSSSPVHSASFSQLPTANRIPFTQQAMNDSSNANPNTHAQWLQRWTNTLPLEPIFRLLDFFIPRIEAMLARDVDAGEDKIMTLIRQTTLVGVLPVPHTIVVRRYVRNYHTNTWFSSYIWGSIYLKQQTPIPFLDSKFIRMFSITSPRT
jgi:hypothetical protein